MEGLRGKLEVLVNGLFSRHANGIEEARLALLFLFDLVLR